MGPYLSSVWALLRSILGVTRSSFKTRRELALENLALRQQIGVLTRTLGPRRLRLGRWDRVLWVALSRGWSEWRGALAIVQPATVIRWHRDGFRRFWTRKSRVRRVGRPGLDREIVKLIRNMSQANVTWGAPRISNELAKLGIELAVSTVAKYMLRRRKPSSPTWRVFLDNHLTDMVALDFFVVPNRHLQGPVRACRAWASPSPRAALQRNGEPDCGMDGSAGCASISGGYRAAVPGT